MEPSSDPLRIGVIPGDGIGPEVIAQGLEVLAAIADLDGLRLELTRFPHGAEHLLATGEVASEAFFARLATMDAIYLGAVGDPRVPPRVLETGLLAGIARRFSMDISLRPYRLHAERLTPMRGRVAGDIDLLVLREALRTSWRFLPARSIRGRTTRCRSAVSPSPGGWSSASPASASSSLGNAVGPWWSSTNPTRRRHTRSGARPENASRRTTPR